jgi:hypothetical protein
VFGSPTATIEVVGNTGTMSSEKAGHARLNSVPRHHHSKELNGKSGDRMLAKSPMAITHAWWDDLHRSQVPARVRVNERYRDVTPFDNETVGYRMVSGVTSLEIAPLMPLHWECRKSGLGTGGWLAKLVNWFHPC